MDFLRQSDYIRLSYDFDLKKVGSGTGKLWIDLKQKQVRMTGYSSDQSWNWDYGKTEVTVIVDGKAKKVYTWFRSYSKEKFSYEYQCVWYPFSEVDTVQKDIPDDQNRLKKARERFDTMEEQMGEGT